MIIKKNSTTNFLEVVEVNLSLSEAQKIAEEDVDCLIVKEAFPKRKYPLYMFKDFAGLV